MRSTGNTAIEWLLGSKEPAIRGMARRDLLDEPADEDLSRATEGPLVRRLLSGQRADGGFGVDSYRKWTGAHWRLVSLVELEVPPDEPRVMAVAEHVLRWFSTPAAVAPPPRINGLYRAHGSMEGNCLGACSRLGMERDPRVRRLAESLVEWQWPDGGWNCDRHASGRRSSFDETLCAIWGLHEYASATEDQGAADAARRGAELLLDHRLFRRHGRGEPVRASWIKLRYPPYWHYGILHALNVLRRMGLAADHRASDAVDIVAGRRGADGGWTADGYWWNAPGAARPNTDVVDWGRGRPNEMLTLNALRVLKAAGLPID